ncbi:rhodanese-like domain-containing protein [Dietzia sp. PP-33]|jgi:rhodanese-related sulfurtransferase|uniref:rhodanese-like domain-containing protein n=1 Tax=Dietzia sp. PP-33 TaxID=2957500 RepID=UPI0029B0F8FC|nr:rhodanese-like domain-containing protein [Dietzia sp. PP-33]MDX2356189.1 rhodanese-like domain-containing protein [Dietzia sp. PP-33]
MSDYAGDLAPQQAWDLLSTDPDTVLVDVRTSAEWQWVGGADLSQLGKPVVGIEWVSSAGEPNQRFVEQLGQAGVGPEAPVLFLCRSGHRSAAAARAATAAGYGPAYNVAEGFEGDPDALGHRGTVNGWKVAGLAWRQS